MTVRSPFARFIFWFVVVVLIGIGISDAFSQCTALRSQFDITFNTDQDCAPATVTDFTITYYFNTAQIPADIGILFEWNDPTNAFTYVDMSTGLGVSPDMRAYTATATFTYPDDNNCFFLPTSYVLIGGVPCTTSAQQQTAFSWARDNEFGGILSIAPDFYDVCYGDPVINATFADNSFFNCNPIAEPDNPNTQMRHVQFVYGTNHNAGSSIRNLTLDDGATQTLTDGTGALAMTDTRGTAGLMITGAYFGPVDALPAPVTGPSSVSFPMDAPADPANAVGNVFEVTMFNWNLCNPYNGDPLNPNYEDAVFTTAYIRIIDAPMPDFVTRKDDVSGIITTDFCIDDIIYFDNNSSAANSFSWEFFDDNAGIVSLGTSNQPNPTFSYGSSGQKLIRLTARNNAAQSNCRATFDLIVNITPSLVAQISTTDLSNNPIIPQFCQDPGNPQTFTVRFNDVSVGTVTPTTEWRWEFYDENNVLIQEFPGPGYSSSQLGPFDRPFQNVGIYTARLMIQDAITGCENIDDVEVIVYEGPQADFTANRVCEGLPTHFTDNSTLNSINGESIISWEWDFDYDGVTFTKDASFDNQTDFDRTYTTPGTYDVALRVTTDQNGCSSMMVSNVTVDPLPLAAITADNNSDCSILNVTFTIDNVGSQPDIVDQYIWEIDDGSGFVVDSIQSPADPGFNGSFSRNFQNFSASDQTLDVRLRAITQNGCETISPVVPITVLSGPRSGFVSLNYSPFADNCSPVSVDFTVDNETQALNPTDYTWSIFDGGSLVYQESTGMTPTFTYNFENTTQSTKNFEITLTSMLASGCMGDSTRLIRISPVPMGGLTLDTLAFDCELMTVRADAIQKGLTNYDWVVRENGVIVSTASGTQDFFIHSVNKTTGVINVDISLVAENAFNCQSTQETMGYSVPVLDDINAGFIVNPLTQTLPNSTVTLTNTTNSGPWTYLWDFGDGNTSTDPTLSSYTYANYGTYTISLTATLDECVEVAAQTISINPVPPVVDFDFDADGGCAPLIVNFQNLSQFADPDSYLWDFGDGTTSTLPDPTHVYYEAGIYSVSLTATNILMDTIVETKTNIIEVLVQPLAAFEVRPPVVLVPDNPIYVSNRSIDAAQFLWDFGDGTTSTEAEPVHYYEEEGNYDIQLIATNGSGCSDTLRRSGVVEAREVGRILIPNAFSPNLDGPGSVSGTNDIFLPVTQQVEEFEMLIFNRWGELLFQSLDKDIGWDGYYEGKLMPQDVYIYKVNLVFENGEKSTRVGDVNLIR